MFDNINIVLVGTTHPGNIGAAARAMKNMGLSQMRLVQPKTFPHAKAIARASGANAVLENAQVFDTFEESLKDCQVIFGTSARLRSLSWPTFTPKECAEHVLAHSGQIAIVFGREHSGLTNEELEQCHYLVQIPTNPQFSSLNIAAAVQVITYELRVNSMAEVNHKLPSPVSSEVMNNFYQHLEQTLIDIKYLDPDNPRLLMRRLHRLFNRTQLMESEINILRGILTAAQRGVKK
jgi:tRNA (cytidine32/uridine32-2'-O)-methyltransferase